MSNPLKSHAQRPASSNGSKGSKKLAAPGEVNRKASIGPVAGIPSNKNRVRAKGAYLMNQNRGSVSFFGE